MHHILISSHLASNDLARRPLFERLHAVLSSWDFGLWWIKQSATPLDTTYPRSTLPTGLFTGLSPLMMGDAHEVSERLLAAAAVEQGTRRLADFRLTLAGMLRYRRFALDVIQQVRPTAAVLWNQFTGLHMALREACEEHEIPVFFAHRGVLPGSLVVEEGGQMGESWVARQSDRFAALPVTEAELTRAADYTECIRRQQRTRKPQAAAGAVTQMLRERRGAARAVIFYAGQNDYQSGMFPPYLPAARLHSPHYVHTLDALYDLAKTAEENDWHVLFKPHPNPVSNNLDRLALPDRLARRITVAEGANIFECIEQSDLTTTILSQVGYLALAHGKPVLMLGRNQLNGAGCAHELSDRRELGRTIETALNDGRTESMRIAWNRHVAQLMRYYLFRHDDDMAEWFARDIFDVARLLAERSEIPHIERTECSQQPAPRLKRPSERLLDAVTLPIQLLRRRRPKGGREEPSLSAAARPIAPRRDATTIGGTAEPEKEQAA